MKAIGSVNQCPDFASDHHSQDHWMEFFPSPIEERKGFNNLTQPQLPADL